MGIAWRPLALVVGLTAAIAAAGLAFPASPTSAGQVAGQADVGYRAVACPGVAATADGSDTVTTFVSQGAANGSGSIAGVAGGPVPLPAPGTAARTTPDPPGSSVVVTALGPAATGTAAVREFFDPADEARGLAVGECVQPAAAWWFVGVSASPGDIDQLLLANPTPSPAVVAIDVLGPEGPIAVLGVGGVVVQPNASATVRIDSLIPGVERASLRVRATVGVISAAVLSTAIDGLIPRGTEFIPAAAAPEGRSVVPGVLPGPGQRELLVTAPDGDAAVNISYLGPDGPRQAPGPPVPVPAGHTVALDITADLGGAAAAVVLTASAPVTAAVRSVVEGGLAPGATGVMNRVPVADVAWTASQSAHRERWLLPVSGVAGTQACAVVSSRGAPASVAISDALAADGGQRQQVDIPAGASVCFPVAVVAGTASLTLVERIAGDGEVHAAVTQWGATSNGPLASSALGFAPETKVPVPAAHPDPATLAGSGTASASQAR